MATDEAGDAGVTGEARLRIGGGVGHFPGLARARTVCFADLAAGERQQLTSLADQADFFGCTPASDAAKPDARTYTIGLTIDGRDREIELAEPIRDPALAKLVSVVRRLCGRRGDPR